MAITKFNSVTGFSVGDETVFDVIDGNANVVANAFSANTANLGDVNNITILGGSTGYTLSTDGSGNLSWKYTGTGNANVAGSNTQIQFNNGINLGASPNLTFDVTTNTLSVTNLLVGNTANIVGNITVTGDFNVTGNIGGNIWGNVIPLGLPTDGNIMIPGLINSWANNTTVTDAIDNLNEAIENVRNNTFVKGTTFTATPLSGGAGSTITLNISALGNPNHYDVTWGDGNFSNAVSTATPTHIYTQPSFSGSPYTVTVKAYNTNGRGEGSNASVTNNTYITIYTPNPVMGFNLYKTPTGGTVMTGNSLYASEGETIYLENTTTNTLMATVAYTVSWGDGTTDTITGDSAAGGVGGSRLSHVYATGKNSGTGSNTITLTLTSHTTADPAVIPRNTSNTIKVYNPAIASPNGLSTKTVSFNGSVGTNPLLVHGFSDRTLAGATYQPGVSVNRSINTTGTNETTVTATYAYDGDYGKLTAYFNGADDGNITLTTANNAGAYNSLVLTSESDYNLLDVTGTSTTFSASIYSPGLYKGFEAKMAKAANAVSVGVNSLQLGHSTTGNTNVVEFVKDDVILAPTVDLTTATIANATNGTYLYISGIPYYNTGSPTVTLSQANLYNWIGQTYQNTTTPFQIVAATNSEGTNGNVIASQTKTYSNLNGSSNFLSSNIPNANTGKTSASPYTIGNQTIAIGGVAGVAAVQTIKFMATNVNGNGNYTEYTNKKIQVFNAVPSGFVENSIPVSLALGTTYTDNAIRIVMSGALGATPAYTNSTNYYTSHAWSGAQTIAGTDEAVVRWNKLTNFTTDLSTGYLPVGPDLSTGRTGYQYFRGAFHRGVVSSFNVTITGKISGFFIAAPGTTIDGYSSLNGWLDATIQYAGSGIPGANVGGNGSNGCAVTGADKIPTGTIISGTTYRLTLGGESLSNATGNQLLFSIVLAPGDYVTGWSFS